MEQFEAGAAKLDITPPVGIELAGYTPRVENTNQSTGINDPLWVRALALRSQGRCVLIIVLDLLGIELPTTHRVRSLTSERLPIAPDSILICCTHNHSGPSILEQYEKGVRVDPIWKEATIGAAVGVAVSAVENLKPAKICAGKREVCGVGANRKAWLDDGSIFHFSGLHGRKPPEARTVVKKGVIDPELSVLCVKDKTDRVIAVLTNYACHPWLYNGNRISSEVSGRCVEWIEEQLRPEHPDVVALFIPGTGSNIVTVQNQTPMPEDSREKEDWFTAERMRMGGILGRAALQVVQEMTEFATAGSVTSEVYGIAAPVYDKKLSVVLAKNGTLPPTDLTMDTEVQVVKIGDIVLVGLPSEVYVEYGLDIKKQSRYRDTLVISYCNDYFADIITHEAVQEGCCPELEWTHVHPGVQDLIMETLEHRVLNPR